MVRRNPCCVNRQIVTATLATQRRGQSLDCFGPRRINDAGSAETYQPVATIAKYEALKFRHILPLLKL